MRGAPPRPVTKRCHEIPRLSIRPRPLTRTSRPRLRRARKTARRGGYLVFLCPNMPPGGGDEGCREPAGAVPSSLLMEEIQRLEVIKRYGERQGWAALLIDGVEVIPAGRPAWLWFLWLSGDKEKQRCVYEYMSKECSGGEDGG